MISNLGSFIEEKASSLPNEIDLAGFLSLAFLIASHDSLAISIPALNLWTKILRSETLGQVEAVQPFTPRLLELATTRLIRVHISSLANIPVTDVMRYILQYESMAEDSTNPSVVFLNEDLDTIPERHAFLGNYRRFCSSIVESITRRRPFEAFPFIISNVDNTLSSLYSNEPPFACKSRHSTAHIITHGEAVVEQYKKNSMPFLHVDAQFSVVEAALKGYMKWADANALEPVPVS